MALALIMSWYVGIGALAAVGSMYLTYKFVPVRFEAAAYGLFLIPVAAFYLACASYFGDETVWNLEAAAVVGFAVLGCLGTRLPAALVAGYALHGAWDLMHELHAHLGSDLFRGWHSTPIPLAYGAFCAMFDWAVVAYFLYRRGRWVTAWTSRAA
jgi:hypothetical protein